MRRSFVGRCFAALFALWFAISLAEPAALHACPMHDGGVAGHAHAGHSAATHGGSGSDAMMHMASHAADTPTAPPTASQCTCLGSCTAGGASAVVPAPDAEFASVVLFDVARPRHGPAVRVATAPPFFLPYANGPPAHATLA